MAVTGGSYGGYMVTWIAGHTDRFKCIINTPASRTSLRSTRAT
jgi:dipeptidyl aminopeptidase/acylaminoacyl peptidase